MTASSVTGVSGPGDSKGKYKPENNCSCSCCCGGEKSKENTTIIKKSGCFTKYKSCSSSIKSNYSNGINIKIC